MEISDSEEELDFVDACAYDLEEADDDPDEELFDGDRGEEKEEDDSLADPLEKRSDASRSKEKTVRNHFKAYIESHIYKTNRPQVPDPTNPGELRDETDYLQPHYAPIIVQKVVGKFFSYLMKKGIRSIRTIEGYISSQLASASSKV